MPLSQCYLFVHFLRQLELFKGESADAEDCSIYLGRGSV